MTISQSVNRPPRPVSEKPSPAQSAAAALHQFGRALIAASTTGLAKQQKAKQTAHRKEIKQALKRDRQIEYDITKTRAIPPTPETIEKKRPHPVEVLLNTGFLDEQDEQTLQRIYDGYRVVIGEIGGYKTPSWARDRVDGGRDANYAIDATHDEKRFKEWWDYLEEEKLTHVFYPMLDLVVDGIHLKEIARRRGVDVRLVKKWIRAGLDAYEASGKQRHRKRV